MAVREKRDQIEFRIDEKSKAYTATARGNGAEKVHHLSNVGVVSGPAHLATLLPFGIPRRLLGAKQAQSPFGQLVHVGRVVGVDEWRWRTNNIDRPNAGTTDEPKSQLL